ncbi:MAG: type II secretion system F family protein [Candidatus Omnitrophota bacterium]
MRLFIMLLIFSAAGLLTWVIAPSAFNLAMQINQKRAKGLSDKMDRMFMRSKINRIVVLYTFAPVIGAVAGFVVAPTEFRWFGLGLGVFLGLIGPGLWIKVLAEKRMDKFNDQLIDALMIMSSSLRGGLSLIQAIEVVTEEMSDPINQEFAILLGENKMGVSLEESFAHLYDRVPSTALNQMITAILLARETGGNLPVIFARIIGVIRENKKIKQNLDNLTMQGRIQGVVMSLLPIGFAFIVTATNKNFFDQMFNSDIGKMLLMYAVASELVGAFLIWKISTFKDF